jgi:hypothetical protein
MSCSGGRCLLRRWADAPRAGVARQPIDLMRRVASTGSSLEARSLAVLTNRQALKLVDLRGGGLSQIGVDNRLATGHATLPGVGHWRYGDRASHKGSGYDRNDLS